MATPYMNLILPTPGSTAGPDWATLINTALGLVDSHDHSTGKGPAVTPAGLNINADLGFGGFQATNLKTAVFADQLSSLGASFLRCAYVAGGDLYFNNGSGTAIQLTAGGTINVSSVNGISGLAAPASASFSTPDFVFKAAATTYGKLDIADIKLFEYAAGITNAITLKSPSALAGSYSITFPPAVPAASAFVMMDASGVLSTTVNNAAFADSIGSAMTSTGANAVVGDVSSWTPTSTVANSVAEARTRATGTSVGVGGVAISSSSGLSSTTSTSYVDVTNLSVTITTSGRPVFLQLIGATSSGPCVIGAVNNSAVFCQAFFKFMRDATSFSDQAIYSGAFGNGANKIDISIPVSNLTYIDSTAAGTYTYKVQFRASVASTTAVCNFAKLVAYEL